LAAIEEVDDAVSVMPTMAPTAPPEPAPPVEYDEAVTVAPIAPPAPPPPSGAKPPPPPKRKPGAKARGKKGALPPPPPPPPPPSTLAAAAKPPPPPLAIRRRRPGALARSSAGVGQGGAGKVARNQAMGINALWDDDEAEEKLKHFERRCTSCGRKYEKGAMFCPSCKEVVAGWLIWLRRVGWLIVIGLAVVAVMNYRRLYPRSQTVDGAPAKGGVEMLSHSLSREKYGDLMYVRGVVTNHSPVDFFYVKVEFEIVDAQGKPLGTVADQLNVISSNAVWNYKALVLDPDTARYINPRVSAVR
jgi:hypothetical protein